jgi:hypothetical protein
VVRKGGQPLAGVTVVAQGPAGEQAELSDERGHFSIVGLAGGDHVIRFYYENLKIEKRVQLVVSTSTPLDADFDREGRTVPSEKVDHGTVGRFPTATDPN